jgi:glutamate 5-kinase
LQLDAGAVRAIVENGSSLLAAGVTKVNGDFSAGDAVDLIDESGKPLARGLIAFDSHEVPSLLGKSTMQIADELGPDYERPLVHRDDLVLLGRLGSRHG